MTEFATYRSCIMANGYLTLTFRFAKKLKTTVNDIGKIKICINDGIFHMLSRAPIIRDKVLEFISRFKIKSKNYDSFEV